jgi:hypothetical protein
MKLKLAFLIPAFALGGCAASSYCEGEHSYQTARSVPAPQSTESLHVLQSESALRIPPPPENAAPYGETVRNEDGDEVVSCLDKPPAMPPPVEPKPAPAQPEATPPEAPKADAPG